MISKSLPNIFTLGNLFFGMLAILMVFNDRPALAALMVLGAMLLDSLDGRVARALNAQSDFGKELDSLADLISFGVAPAFIMYVVAFQDIAAAGWIVTALFPLCGALRLARFNVIAGTPGFFIGLPIPAAGGFLSVLALFASELPVWILVLSTLCLSYLMISRVKYPSFKRTAIPRAAWWLTPILILVVVAVALFMPQHLVKLVFVPLLLYALYGLKKNVNLLRRISRKHRSSAKDSVLEEASQIVRRKA